MADAESLGKKAGGNQSRGTRAFDREQRLMLLRAEARGEGGIFAEDQEMAQHIAELGEPPVICRCQPAPRRLLYPRAHASMLCLLCDDRAFKYIVVRYNGYRPRIKVFIARGVAPH